MRLLNPNAKNLSSVISPARLAICLLARNRLQGAGHGHYLHIFRRVDRCHDLVIYRFVHSHSKFAQHVPEYFGKPIARKNLPAIFACQKVPLGHFGYIQYHLGFQSIQERIATTTEYFPKGVPLEQVVNLNCDIPSQSALHVRGMGYYLESIAVANIIRSGFAYGYSTTHYPHPSRVAQARLIGLQAGVPTEINMALEGMGLAINSFLKKSDYKHNFEKARKIVSCMGGAWVKKAIYPIFCSIHDFMAGSVPAPTRC